MRSIRLSLVVYILLLLGVVLAAVSGLVYQTTTQALQAKEESTRKLLYTQYLDRRKEINERLDQRLRDRVRSLAASARQVQKPYEYLNPLGGLGAALQPQGHLFVPLWVGEGVSPSSSGFRVTLPQYLYQKRPPAIRIDRAEEIM